MTSNRGSGVAAAPGMAENERQERRSKELEFMLPPHTFQWENLIKEEPLVSKVTHGGTHVTEQGEDRKSRLRSLETSWDSWVPTSSSA